MRAIQQERGVILYTKDREDLVREAVVALARRSAQKLSDEEAAGLGGLFDPWKPGKPYTAGTRIADAQGNLYRVTQDHVGEKGHPIACTQSLYTPLDTEADDRAAKKSETCGSGV
ncbi:MAG: hypothetical protein LKK00_05840 [Intestinimonas sp.]|jgi:hypothetical protein|nr:hypothetical protein [Intestinimonas sp.]